MVYPGTLSNWQNYTCPSKKQHTFVIVLHPGTVTSLKKHNWKNKNNLVILLSASKLVTPQRNQSDNLPV